MKHRIEPSSRIGAADGLRAFAMLLVFGFHLHRMLAGYYPNAVWQIMRGAGGYGLDLFLVLSGCMVYRGLMSRPVAYGTFLCRRAWRIFPLYLAVLMLYIGAGIALPQFSEVPAGFWPGLWTMLENALLISGLTGGVPIVTVSWALSYIFAFYLICPFLIGLLRCRRKRVRVAAALGFFAVSLCASAGLGFYQPRVSLLFVGMAIGEAGGAAGWMLAACAGLGLGLEFTTAGAARFLGHGAAVTGVCAMAVHGTAYVKTALGTRPLVWLGERSYAFYLCHGMPILFLEHVVIRRFRDGSLFWVSQALALFMAVVVAQLAYFYVEKPLRAGFSPESSLNRLLRRLIPRLAHAGSGMPVSAE